MRRLKNWQVVDKYGDKHINNHSDNNDNVDNNNDKDGDNDHIDNDDDKDSDRNNNAASTVDMPVKLRPSFETFASRSTIDQRAALKRFAEEAPARRSSAETMEVEVPVAQRLAEQRRR